MSRSGPESGEQVDQKKCPAFKTDKQKKGNDIKKKSFEWIFYASILKIQLFKFCQKGGGGGGGREEEGAPAVCHRLLCPLIRKDS